MDFLINVVCVLGIVKVISNIKYIFIIVKIIFFIIIF